MRFSTITASAVAAAVVSAAPVEKRALTTEWIVEVVTSYVTVYPSATPSKPSSGNPSKPTTTPSVAPFKLPPKSSGAAPKPTTTSSVAAPKPTTTSTLAAPTTTSKAPVPITTSNAPAPITTTTSAAAQPTSGSGSTTAGTCSAYTPPTDLSVPLVNCGVSVLDVANKWRAKYGKPAFKWATNIATAAKSTADYNKGGVTMVHPGLVDGSQGECITPGFWETGTLATQGLSPFEVALMGWLCEVGSDPQLQPAANNGIDVCGISHNVASISGDVNGGTGHHDIFLGDYTTIGVYYENNQQGDGGWPQFAGQWTADFGRA